jgi:hypothetical protein
MVLLFIKFTSFQTYRHYKTKFDKMQPHLDIPPVSQYPVGKGVICLKIKNVLMSILGGGVLAFGLYHVQSISGVTEGGALGLTLLLNH